MRQHVLIVILLAALSLPMACTDKSTESKQTVIDTLVVRDIDYMPRRIYDLGRLPIRRSRSDTLPGPDKYDFAFPNADSGIVGDSVTRLVVYRDDLSGDPAERFSRPVGICYIDPDDTLSDDPGGIYRTAGYFETLTPGTDYYLQPTQFYIEFLRSIIGNNDILAVYMEVLRRRADSTWIDTIGDINSDTMKLKLIKPTAYLDVNHHVWEYAWRNIYDLGRTIVDLFDFNLEVYHGQPVDNNRIDPADSSYNDEGIKYIEILGLDRGDNNGQGVPDGEIDRYVYVDQTLGLLIFPSRHPFDDTISYVNDSHGDPVYLNDSVPEIYLDIDRQNLPAASKYYLGIFYMKQ
jgi:hypothetical protein